MILSEGVVSDFDLLEFIVTHLNHIEKESKDLPYTSDEKLDYVLEQTYKVMAPYDYVKNEKLLIIVINGLVKMGNGEYRVLTNPHKNKSGSCCCSCCCTIL